MKGLYGRGDFVQQTINIQEENTMNKYKLLNAEKQINEGKTVKATDVFDELKEKYQF